LSTFIRGDKVIFKDPEDVKHRAYTWKIVDIWDTNVSGLRAYLSRPDDTKKFGLDRCAAQLTELERVK